MKTRQYSHLSVWFGILVLWVGCMLIVAQDEQVIVLEVSGTIDLGLAPFTRRVLQEAEQVKAAAVILHINTPGGRVDAAIQMRDALLNSSIETVAFIDKEAYSAGALIALASHKIYMTGGAVIGAATPVDQQGQKAGEKYISAIRKLFRATAEQRGRPPEVAEAMVDEDVVIPGLIEKGKLLTLTTQEALSWKVADGQVDTLEQLLTHLNLSSASLQRPRANWAEALVRVLTQPTVASVLLLVGLLGLWVEFLTPGFGVGGVFGVVSLALFLGGHYLVGLAGWEEILLLGLGLLLLALELFVIPGFGIAGVLGILAIGSGLFLSFLGSLPTAADMWRAGTTVLAVGGLVTVGITLTLLFLPVTPMWSRLSLKARLDGPSDTVLPAAPSTAPPLLGAVGTTATPLLPSGIGMFHGQRLDIISEGAYIPVGTSVRIVQVRGNRLVVRPDEARNQPDREVPSDEGV